MIRVISKAFYYTLVAIGSMAVILIGTPLLMVLGRAVTPRGELVVDDDLLEDDPGVDVDGEYVTPLSQGIVK